MTQQANKETYKLYGGAVSLEYYPKRHIYSVDGKGVYGVTGIVGLLPKPWMAGYVRKYARIYLQGKELTNEAIDKALVASDQYGAEAMQTGTNVHKYVQNWMESNVFPKPKNKEELNSFGAFWVFLNKYKLVPIFLERRIYSKLYQYAGTADCIGLLNGIRTVIDWKTSERIYASYFLQGNAYAQALNEEIKADPALKKQVGGKIEQVAIVRLGKDGTLEVETQKVDKGKLDVFLHLLAIKDYLSK